MGPLNTKSWVVKATFPQRMILLGLCGLTAFTITPIMRADYIHSGAVITNGRPAIAVKENREERWFLSGEIQSSPQAELCSHWSWNHFPFLQLLSQVYPFWTHIFLHTNNSDMSSTTAPLSCHLPLIWASLHCIRSSLHPVELLNCDKWRKSLDQWTLKNQLYIVCYSDIMNS